MKKALLGTTALVAAGVLATGAMAADIIAAPAMAPVPEPIEEGFTLTTSGFATSGFSYGDTNSCDAGKTASSCVGADGVPNHGYTPTGVGFDAEIMFRFVQTLANGLEVGGRIELEGQNNFSSASTFGTDIDEAWIYMEGHFGELRLGGQDDALWEMSFLPSSWGKNNGIIDLDDFHGLALTTYAAGSVSYAAVGGDDNRVMYITPRFAGIQLGASYTPSERGNGPTYNSDLRSIVLESDDDFGQSWSFAGNVEQSWGDTKLTVASGYRFVEADSANAGSGDIDVWALNGKLGGMWGSVSVHYAHSDTDVITGNGTSRAGTTGIKSRTTVGIGGAFNYGDYTIGGGYGWADADLFDGTDSHDDRIRFGFNNNLAAGVDWGVNATIESADFSATQAPGGASNLTGYKVNSYLALAF